MSILVLIFDAISLFLYLSNSYLLSPISGRYGFSFGPRPNTSFLLSSRHCKNKKRGEEEEEARSQRKKISSEKENDSSFSKGRKRETQVERIGWQRRKSSVSSFTFKDLSILLTFNEIYSSRNNRYFNRVGSRAHPLILLLLFLFPSTMHFSMNKIVEREKNI